MLDIDRSSSPTRQAENRAVAAISRSHRSYQVWASAAAPAPGRRGSLILPTLLVIVLAAAAIGLSPATTQLYASLGDFPCGP